MKWTLNEPKKGDIVRVKLGGIYHYGVYVSDDEVVQFGLPPTDLRRDSSKVEVCASSADVFACGKFLEVGEAEDKKEAKLMFPPDKIVENARKRLGEKGYHILYNNCEHFARQCAFGETYCSQVEEVRKMWKTFPFVNVFVEKFPFKTKNDEIFPVERKIEIDKCGNVDVQQERFYDWKLLEYAIRQSLGLDIKNITFRKKHFKWECDNFEFSLSHCGNIVAVVVSRNPVGIDVEEKNEKRFSAFPPEKILTQNEMQLQDYDGEGLNKIWTVKEAVFKKGGFDGFNPAKIETTDQKFSTKEIVVDGKEYFLTVATNDLSFAKYHFGESVKVKK